MEEKNDEKQEAPMEDVEAEKAEKAEAAAVHGKAKTLLHNAYRGRKE